MSCVIVFIAQNAYLEPRNADTELAGLSIRVRLLRSLPQRFKVDIRVKPGSHQSEHARTSDHPSVFQRCICGRSQERVQLTARSRSVPQSTSSSTTRNGSPLRSKTRRWWRCSNSASPPRGGRRAKRRKVCLKMPDAAGLIARCAQHLVMTSWLPQCVVGPSVCSPDISLVFLTCTACNRRHISRHAIHA